LANPPLDDQLRTPQTWQTGGVKDCRWGCSDSRLEDTVIFSVDAAAGEDDCADLLAVIADLATSIVAVYRSDWSSIVSCADYFVVFDDNRPNCFL